MEFPIVIVLALLTLGLVLVFGLINKRAVENRMENDDSVKSTLAADKSSTGKPADVK